MKCRLLALAFVTIIFSTPSQAILLLEGELTTTDALAEDPGWGNFYYDLYSVLVDDATTLDVTLTATDPLIPWLGYWDGDFTATPNYFDPPPTHYEPYNAVPRQELSLSFNALPGIEYQIMAATWNYNPTDLGQYTLEVLPVPAPSSWLMLALGLVILGSFNRFVLLKTV